MAKANHIRVLFVRSGRTEWDEAGRIAGSTDLPLSPAGRAAAEELAAALNGAKLATIFCAPDEASTATAAALARGAGAKVRPVEELADIHLGLWEGMLATELEDKCPRAYRQWVDDPASVSVPEGESLEEAQQRVCGALGRVLERVRSGAVGVVLRPISMGLVSCCLDGQPNRGLWAAVQSAPTSEWRTVERAALNGGAGGRPAKAGATQ